MYNAFYRLLRYAWPGDAETRRHLRELHATQWLSQEELAAWQLQRLQALVTHAYAHVPYYQQRYAAAGIHPHDIQTLRDFQALPVLTKEDINQHPDLLIAQPRPQTLDAESTGGSTGYPLRFFVERSFWWWNAALEIRGRSWHGVRAGDKIAWIWGAVQDLPDSSRKERLKAALLRHRFLNAFSMTEPKMAAFAAMLRQWQPTMFRAYPSALGLFARFLQEHGITDIRPRLIETSAEKLTEPQRQLFTEVFGCPIADCYSGRELGTIAYECDAGSLHVCETRFLETVNEVGQVLPGQMGEIVITSLHQWAMPLIRYKNGDMGIIAETPCGCGRGMPVLQEVVGRVSDFLVNAEGQFVHSTFFARVFRLRPEVVCYQVYQPDHSHLDLQFVCKTPTTAAWLTALQQEIQARFGASMHIALHQVADIPLTPAGKHRFVISDIPPTF